MQNNFPLHLLRSRRRTLTIQVNSDLSITVRAPLFATDREIERVLREKQPWIEKQLARIKLRNEELKQKGVTPLTDEDIRRLMKQAKELIPQRVAYFAPLVGVSYGRVSIRHQKTRWGSCSSRGTLSFNCALMLVPSEALDYVVVHELCHRKCMNHSKEFWAEVARVLPDYKSRIAMLKRYSS